MATLKELIDRMATLKELIDRLEEDIKKLENLWKLDK